MFNYKRSHVVNNSWILINRKAKLHLYNEKEGHVITMYSFFIIIINMSIWRVYAHLDQSHRSWN
jgi:hypothetical protein